eukprot:826578-Rhodomonas_salina.1
MHAVDVRAMHARVRSRELNGEYKGKHTHCSELPTCLQSLSFESPRKCPLASGSPFAVITMMLWVDHGSGSHAKLWAIQETPSRSRRRCMCTNTGS